MEKKRKVVASSSIHISSEGGHEELSVVIFPYKSQKVSDQWVERTIFQPGQEVWKWSDTDRRKMTSMWIWVLQQVLGFNKMHNVIYQCRCNSPLHGPNIDEDCIIRLFWNVLLCMCCSNLWKKAFKFLLFNRRILCARYFGQICYSKDGYQMTSPHL